MFDEVRLWLCLQTPISNWAWPTDAYAVSTQPTLSTCEEQQFWDLPTDFFIYGWKDYRCVTADLLLPLAHCFAYSLTGRGYYAREKKTRTTLCAKCCVRNHAWLYGKGNHQ